VFRLRGRGLPQGGARGDAHVRVGVETPTALGTDARALMEQLGRALDDAALPRRRAFRDASHKAPSAHDATIPGPGAGEDEAS